MTRGRWERVVAARRQSREALGQDPNVSYAPPKSKTPQPASPGPVWVEPGPSVGVLSLGEAAARLGVSRTELEAIIDAGKIEAVSVGLTRMIPTNEVARLTPL